MNVLVFCSAQQVPEKYTNAAEEVATLIAQKGHTLVWGGSNGGTMKVIAEAAQAAGGKIIGVSTEFFKERVRQNADEIIMTKDLAERKKVMLDRADAVIVLAGGIGTLDEATEVLALKRQGDHAKPVIFLNTDGFYDGLKLQLEHMDAEGFFKSMDHDVIEGRLMHFATNAREAIGYLE